MSHLDYIFLTSNFGAFLVESFEIELKGQTFPNYVPWPTGVVRDAIMEKQTQISIHWKLCQHTSSEGVNFYLLDVDHMESLSLW